MRKYKLSVITINLNNSEGLRDTIKSVIRQTSNEFEFIVIDGGSEIKDIDIIHEYEQQIDFWVSEKDRGVYDAMNKGVTIAHGDYCIFLNSGDKFYDNEVVNNILDLLDGTDIITGSTWLSFGRLVASPQTVSMSFLYNQTLCHQSSFIKTELLKENPYDINLKYVSDWKFWIEMIVFKNASYKSIKNIISIYDWNGISTLNYVDVDKEKENILYTIFPSKILLDYRKFVIGDTWEDKLYIEMKDSRFHKFFYTINVCIIRFMQIFRKSASWIYKYPVRLN